MAALRPDFLVVDSEVGHADGTAAAEADPEDNKALTMGGGCPVLPPVGPEDEDAAIPG